MYAPYGHRLPNDTATWHPEPRRRGTFGLLSTCLITIGLCVWTSMHLNLPEPGKQNRHLWRKLGWLVCGLFAPELVAWTAFQQNKEAKYLLSEMNAKLVPRTSSSEMSTWKRILLKFMFKNKGAGKNQSEQVELDVEDSPQQKRYTWTMIQGHYGVMGGFAVDISGPSHNFHPKGHDKIILSGEDLLFVADHAPESIPDISDSEIVDKSNADGLAKFLVCIQAFWFCVQCITRMGQKLTISLLELNTFAHALCTLLIYFLWWDKPLDIKEPTLLRGERVVKLIALVVSTDMSMPCFKGHDKYGFELKEDDPKYRVRLREVKPYYLANLSRPQKERPSDAAIQKYAAKFPVKAGYRRVHYGEYFHGFYFNKWLDFVDISPAQQAQLQLWEGFYEHEPDILGKVKKHQLTGRMSDWSFLHTIDMKGLLGLTDQATSKGRQFVIGLWVAGLVYGCLHLTAWNASFNTSLQEALWRISALSLSLSGFAFVFWIALWRTTDWLEDHQLVFPGSIFGVLTLVSSFGFIVLYLFSRAYIVVECFLSIPHLPASVYEVPAWSQYFPHIG